MYTPIFIIVLFTIAKIWKSPKCSSMDEWRNKMWYIYTIEFRFKRKEVGRNQGTKGSHGTLIQ